MSNLLYTFIRRPSSGYELKTYSPEEFAAEFKLDRPHEEWAAAGNTLDDVVEFTSAEDAREFIRNERQTCSITDEDADELFAELDKLTAVASVECYESSITPLVENAENGAYRYALEAVQSLEAAQWIFDALQRYELSDEEIDALMRRADIANALEYADICVIGVNTQDALIDAAYERIQNFASLGWFARVDEYSRLWAELHVCSGLVFRCAAGEWICHCTNSHGKYEEFHGLFFADAAVEALDLLASEIAECYEEI